MNRKLCLILALVFVAGCGGADTHESLHQEEMAKLKELNTVLSEVVDKPSFRANHARIVELHDELQRVQERKKELEPAPREVQIKQLTEVLATEPEIRANLARVLQYKEVDEE